MVRQLARRHSAAATSKAARQAPVEETRRAPRLRIRQPRILGPGEIDPLGSTLLRWACEVELAAATDDDRAAAGLPDDLDEQLADWEPPEEGRIWIRDRRR